MQVGTTSLERAKALYNTISGEARESELAGRLTDRAAQALLDPSVLDAGRPFEWATPIVRGFGGRLVKTRLPQSPCCRFEASSS
jgi:hypothetical protein